MIFTERTIKVTNGASQINSPIVLYKGDKNVKIRFKIVDCPYTYSKNVDNIIEVSEASYAQLVIKTPNDGLPIFSDIAETESGYVTFTITDEMIDEAKEVGKYSFQVRLLDDEKFSRITIPEVVDGIDVRDPIAIEDISPTNEVDVATVGYALITAAAAEDTFDSQGNYNKTTWTTGDRITAPKLNKIEDGIDRVNQELANASNIDDTTASATTTYSSNKIETIKEELTQQINAGPAKGSITDNMLSSSYVHAEPGKNLFNKNDCEIGKYVTDNGGLDNNADYCASHFIKVEPLQSYFLAVTESWGFQFCYYNANKEFVSKVETRGGVFEIPENCYYVRFTFKPVDLNTIQFEKGTKQTQYEEYKVGLPSKSVNINNLSDALLDLINSGSEGGYRVVCRKNGTELIVGFKYNSNEDFRILFKPCGQSNLPQINKIYKLDNANKLPSSDFSNYGTLFQNESSDWVGPYICRTSNNDGDKPDSWEFTGGWHGYNGDQSGSATARNVSTKYYIDNIEIVDDSTKYGNEIKIVVVNNVQSTDTKKEDGSGRECLQETIIYTITPNNVNVDVEIKALENVKITTYHGLQTVNNSYDGQILYIDDETMKGWTDCSHVKIDGGTKTNSDCGEYKLKKDNDLLIAWIDKNYGLGKRKYVNTDKPLVWTADYNKSYMVLVNGNLDLVTNQILNWRGGYKFISLI